LISKIFTNMFTIRKATPKDTPIIFDLIKKLAVYEKLENEVVTSVEELREQIFEKKFAHVIIGEENGIPAGFALYFYNFSTFVGKPGLYLEDLYIEPEHRGKGYGKTLLIELTKIAKAENCGRMEWSVLNWNTPAIDFYKSLQAKPMEEWSVYRLDQKGIADLAE
jgi:GNAT superfamily N-acetyltransferase